MFNIGGAELIVIGVVALIVLGPDKLPGAIRQVGSFVGELRRISSGFQTDLRGALDEAEREAEAQRRANAAAPDAGTPDPGAARAAAHAELAAAEAALAQDEASSPASGSVGEGEASVSSTDDEDPSHAAS